MYPETTLPLFKVFMAPEVGEHLLETLYSGYLTQGDKVDIFEELLCKFLDAENLLTVNSGTSALQLALHLSGAGPNTAVISTPMTCTATNTAIRAVGADILWADIDPNSGNISPESVETLLSADINNRIKAVMAVDWAGYPCNLTALRYVADRYGVKLIEDAAHAFGARYFGQYLAARLADFTCYSFQAIKHLTTGDGGALICRSPQDYEQGKLLRWFGIDRTAPRKDFRCETDVKSPGFKYHMNDLNATIGIYQLPYMPNVIAAHVQNGTRYDRDLKLLEGRRGINLVKRNSNTDSAHWIYTLHVEERQEFMDYMAEHHITTSQVHARNDTHTMFEKYIRPLPGVDAFSSTQVNIPCGWWIDDHAYNYIVDTITAYTEYR